MANVPSGGAARVGQRSLDDPGAISIGLAHYGHGSALTTDLQRPPTAPPASSTRKWLEPIR